MDLSSFGNLVPSPLKKKPQRMEPSSPMVPLVIKGDILPADTVNDT